MFESAELGHAVDKRTYDREVPKLRADLLDAQLRILEGSRSQVIVVFAGFNGAGTGDVVNLLLEWMDPHHVQVHAQRELTDEERARPPMWRFWRILPPHGKTGIFFGSWYADPLEGRVHHRLHGAELAVRLAEIRRFERMLVDEGALVVKVWLHLTKQGQRKRLEKLESSRATAWRVTKQDWRNQRLYDRYRRAAERVLRHTSTAEAAWTVIEATDPHYRNLTVGRSLLDAMVNRLKSAQHAVPVRAASPPPPPIDARNVLEELDLSKSISEAQYEKKLPLLQGRLNALARHKRFGRFAAVLVFEGLDAAGKGGTIRRITRALDARTYDVVPVGAPSDEERARPYLWRFWRHIPRKGHFAIFDRSWYGRLLVERVEGLAPEPDWMRAYHEIVDFEESLVRSGIVVVKFWLTISPDEQLARFRARAKTPFKRFKLTSEDWRNRKKWALYERAVCDMVDRTSTDIAPWHLVEANDKKWARVKVLETVCQALKDAMK
ncbi:MAG TPA: polyphosphate:AMP phosphotransferase [Polyangiaceae bacterium]|jgi:polyphosphate:AMP phosphotransferase|nr:polyphosphate:AMP phosphotransferase [Polyangiaceae bacterium]